jgi:Protein of unknown function (DUF2474)
MPKRARQLGWFVGIWMLSVAALGVVSLCIRAVLH